jgi:hypothetical protein
MPHRGPAASVWNALPNTPGGNKIAAAITLDYMVVREVPQLSAAARGAPGRANKRDIPGWAWKTY